MLPLDDNGEAVFMGVVEQIKTRKLQKHKKMYEQAKKGVVRRKFAHQAVALGVTFRPFGWCKFTLIYLVIFKMFLFSLSIVDHC